MPDGRERTRTRDVEGLGEGLGLAGERVLDDAQFLEHVAGILVAIAVAGLNLGVLPGLTGFTIGKWAAGLRILQQDGSEIGIGRALLRHFVGYPLSFITLGLGFLVIAFTSRGRGLHDLIAGTVVVRQGPAIGVSGRSV